MANSFVEVCHVLGLGDNPVNEEKRHEGMTSVAAVRSVKSRYNQFRIDRNSDLKFDTLGYKLFEKADYKKMCGLKNGGYVGFLACWEDHAFSIHAIKEGDNTHFIYVNRGQRHYVHNKLRKKIAADDTVMVFTIPNIQAEEFAKKMTSVAAYPEQEQRKAMSAFLNSHQNKLNPDLTAKLAKKDQKTGNCPIANSNIAWHFQLASNRMQESISHKTPITFLEAYATTKTTYKSMRLRDRIEAYEYLLAHKEEFHTRREYFYDYIQPLVKFNNREQAKSLVDEVKRTSNTLFLELTEPLLNLDFTINTDFYIRDRIKKIQDDSPTKVIEQKEIDLISQELREDLHRTRYKILEHSFQYLEKETQIKAIENDILLLRYATPEVQTSFLDTSFEKYALYSSPEIQSIFLKTHPQYSSIDRGGKEDPKIRFLDHLEQLCTQRKTNDAFLLTDREKSIENNINEKLKTLYVCTYVHREDAIMKQQAIDALFLACYENPRPFGDSDTYYQSTGAALWLMASIEKFPWFRGLLGFSKDSTPEQIKSEINKRVDELTKNKNIAASDESTAEIKSSEQATCQNSMAPDESKAEIESTEQANPQNSAAPDESKAEIESTEQANPQNSATPDEPKAEVESTVQVNHQFKARLQEKTDSQKAQQQTIVLTKSF